MAKWTTALLLAGCPALAGPAGSAPFDPSWRAPTLMRYPTVSSSGVAFVAHGDLWVSPPGGGTARRLVRSRGSLLAPRFSPDGRWIAYSERARGGQDVYAVPVVGGGPRRLTHDAQSSAGSNLVVGWTPDGSRVLFLSTRASVAAKQVQAFSVPLAGGLAERLPLDQAGRIDISPADGRIAYTRTFTDLAARKRYTGGMAEDLFLYDPASRRLDRLTDWKGTDTAPMWAGDRLYFLSDRGAGFRLNLWCLDPATRHARQVTHFGDGDVDWPSAGGGRIVFQQGGRLWALELADERLHALAIRVADDGARTAPRTAAVAREARAQDVTGAVDYATAPDGAAAVIVAHGDLFRVTVAGTVDLTASPGLDEDHPAVSPDGQLVAYVTEDAHAQQVAVRPLAGGPERRLTRFADGVLYAPTFSPDGRRLAVADAEHRLWLVPLSGGEPVLAARDPVGEIRDAAFSPDGRWLAYGTVRPNGLGALHLRDLASGRDVVLSGDLDGDRLPAFSADGSHLFFVSRRHDLMATGDRGDEASLATIASDGLYVAPLDRGPDGLMARASALPVTPGRITAVAVRGGALFYEARPLASVGGELPGTPAMLHRIDAAGADTVVLRDFESQVVSGDGRHVLFHRADGWRRLTIGDGDTRVDLSTLRARVEPRAEWRAMFEHAWRLDRDLFFNRAMNGSDWAAVHRAYARYLPLLGSRDDALFLLGQLQGELATSHAFIGGLDADEAAPPVATPRLGADLVLDPAKGRYRFAHVYRGDPTRERFRAPLNDPAAGVEVRDGAYLLAIDGMDLRPPTDPDALLAGKTALVTLTVADTPDGTPRDVHVRPLMSDLALRQHDWVEANRARVAARSGGRVGYLFLPDFDEQGAEELARQWQGVVGQDGLVIDLRWNRGGYLSQAVLSLLRRTRAGAFVNREGALEPLPLLVAPRAMAAIVNAQSASDGDQFPYFFHTLGLGPVIGQRTWGGVQGIKGPWPLMDGTTLTIPKDSLASTDGHWIIENEGSVPDIAVDPDPDGLETGRDPLLEAATAVVRQRLVGEQRPSLRPPPALPAYPGGGKVPGASFRPR